MANASLTPPLKWHGGKHYLAPKIIALMPQHTHYVEPFAGGLAVLLAKDPEGVSEVVNDLDRRLTNFWHVMRVPEWFERFHRTAQSTPFSEVEWDFSHLPAYEPWLEAFRFFVLCRQSMAGRMKDFAPLSRTRTRRGMNEQASAWMAAVDGLPAVHARLRRVVVLNRPAVEVLRSQDGPDTLFYLDPPYLKSTRTAPDVYAHEMTAADHHELLETVVTLKGKVMLSGYPSEVYETALEGWTRHEFDLPNNAASGKSKGRETEVVWCNF